MGVERQPFHYNGKFLVPTEHVEVGDYVYHKCPFEEDTLSEGTVTRIEYSNISGKIQIWSRWEGTKWGPQAARESWSEYRYLYKEAPRISEEDLWE